MHTISLNTWVELPNPIRYKIREIFNIPRSSNTMVVDGMIESDGTTHEDIQHLTIEKMQKYLGDASEDLHVLFDKVVARVNDELQGRVNIVEVPVIEIKKKKNAKKE